MRDEGSVGRLLSRAFGVLVALIVGAGLAELAVVLVQHRTVHELASQVQPLEITNGRVRTVLTTAYQSMWSYLETGNGDMLTIYHGARGDYITVSRELDELTATRDRSAVIGLLNRADRWWSIAERQRLAPPAEQAGYTAQSTEVFTAFTAEHERFQRTLDARSDQLRRRSAQLQWFTVGLFALITVVVAGLAVGTAVRTRRRIVGPLREVTDVLGRRRAGDRSVRAAVHGPTEIREVAEAVNAAAEQSELVRRQEEQMLARLQALDNAKSDFMATVSHELRTPLTSISGYLELLRDAPPGELSDAQDRMLEVIARNTRRLRELIEDILTLSRIETGEFHSETETVDLAEVIERGVAAIAPAAAKASVGVHCDVRGPLPLTGDGAQLDKVLANLLSNAVKFTKPEGTVTVRAECRDDEVVLVVADTGMGIPADEQKALFARFFRASNAVRLAVPGTGLGLAIIKTIVENHRGAIDFESTENVGTTVTVRLPAAPTA